jgi:signal transduction histidine kinase/ActR/RegA family two-component response regulator
VSKGRRGGHWRIRRWTAAAFLAVLVPVIVTSTAIDRIAEQQDERLLEERTGEVAVFLESSMSEIERTFPFLAGVLQLAADPAQGFQAAAGTIVGDSVRGVGMAEPVGGFHEITALVGEGPAVGTPAGEAWDALFTRARAEGEVVTGVLPSATGDETRVGFAYAPEALAAVLFMELHFDPPNVIHQEPGSPFSDIRGAMYVGMEERASHLVLTTAKDLPLTGNVVRDSITVGADEWLVVTTTDEPLVGPLAEQTRWGVLIGGFVLALLAGTLVEMLSRRRAYAFRLVEERTADLQEARRVAEDANRSKSQFLSRMSHELRTPLNAVLGFGQLLEIEPLEPEQHDSVAQILKGGRHLLDLINEVLDISRIEAGELTLSPEAVYVPDLVDEAVDLIKPLASQTGIQVLVDRSGVCDCYAFADRQRAKQILLNLLSNAVKYNRARGTVSVSCQQPSDTVLSINVTDTGPGIPAERIGQLFTAFERLGAEHTAVEGTGIGLAVSLRLAEVMGGRLGVQSTLGHGSTFSVELPRVEGPVERYERLHDGGHPASTTPSVAKRPVVLHIEDNLSNLKLVERIFAQRDVEVVGAMQGRLGLELAREHQPTLVLLDLHLPDLGGEQVLQRLRDDPVTASIPVVIVSADATTGHIQRLLTAGATAYLTKPIDVRELLATLDHAISRRSRG